MTYALRPYQQKADDRARALLGSGHRSVLFSAPTGSGKTVLACAIIAKATAKGSRTLFVAHRSELITQCAGKLDESSIPHGIIKAGFEPNPNALVQIASVQTYARRIDKLEHGYRLIIVDEAHHARSDTYAKLLTVNPNAILLGLTATPYRLDSKGLGGDLFQCMIEVETVQGLTDTGFLVPSRVFVGSKVDLAGVKTIGGDWSLDDLEERMNTPKITGDIVKEWTRLAWGRPTICFATRIEHSKMLVAAFQAVGVKAEHLDGKTPAAERDAVNARFRSGTTTLVSNCGVWTEGADFPMCSCIIFARPTQSRCLFKQMGGRGLRISPESHKRDCLLLDHANITGTHGFLTDPDDVTLTEGLKAADTRERWKCNKCGALLRSKPKVCPACGAEHAQAKLELDMPDLGDDGYTLVELKEPPVRRKRKHTPESAKFMFFRDVATARARGWKPGRACVLYKTRTGQWPSAELRATAPHPIGFGRDKSGKSRMIWLRPDEGQTLGDEE